MANNDNLGHVRPCSTCGQRVRYAWWADLFMVIDLEPDPIPFAHVDRTNACMPWNGKTFTTACNGIPPDRPTYVPHDCPARPSREEHRMTAPQQTDPFATTSSRPSFSWKGAPVGTVVTFTITDGPVVRQSTDFDTRQPKYWPNGDPVETVVTGVRTSDGQEWSLWAEMLTKKELPTPCPLFNAIAAAQRAAKDTVKVGGTLVVTLAAHKPNPDKPHLAPQNLFSATYTPPSAFDTAPANDPWSSQSPQAVPQQAAPQAAAAPTAPAWSPTTGNTGADEPPF